MKKLMLTMFFILFAFLSVLGQDIRVTGKVKSSDGKESLSGVFVKVKGTSRSVKTDKDGNFEIFAQPNDVLVVSYDNFSVEEIQVDRAKHFDIVLVSEDVETLDLLSLSLEELLQVNVSTVSKREERIEDTPAIIEVFTSEEIANMGIDNLSELLGMIAGVEVMETYYGYTAIQFRGILQNNYNNKANLLLNGQPLYDQIVSSFYLEQIPLSSIQQIEIIRGPGGVIYGTNAFAGVINIITKEVRENTESSIAMKYGSFNTKNFKITGGKKVNDVSVFFAADFNRSDGYEKHVDWDEDDVNPLNNELSGSSGGSRVLGYYPDDPNGYENDFFNLFSSIDYKGLSVNGNYFFNQKDKFGIIPTLASTGERTLEGFAGNIKYNHSFSDELRTSVILWHDRISKEERVNTFPPVIRANGHPVNQQYSGAKTGTQFELGFVSNEFDLIGGVGYEISSSDPYLYFFSDSIAQGIQNRPANAYVDQKSAYDIWSFAQGTYEIADKLNIMAGVRVNSNQYAGNVVIPNAGVVYRPTDGLSVKFLYGMGYRNPSFFEKFVFTVNTLAGNEGLKTEKVSNFDLGLDYKFLSYSLRLNGFYMQTSNEISRAPLTVQEIAEFNDANGYGEGDMLWTGGARYINAQGNTYTGVEFSFFGYPHRNISFRGNLSYKTAKTSSNEPITEFSPFLANFLLSYKPHKKISVSPYLQYIGERKINYSPYYPWNEWDDGEYAIKPYSLLNIRLSYEIVSDFSVAFLAKNILDVEYFYPEYIRKGIPYIPGGPGRSIFLEVTYKL